MTETAFSFEIEINTRFLDEQSRPGEDRYVFAYTIAIRNTGNVAAHVDVRDQTRSSGRS